MKKSLVFFALALVGCVGAKEGTYTTSIFNPAPPQMIRNEKCEDIPAIRVFQVLDKSILARACEYGKYTGDLFCDGYVIYMKKEKGKIYYDDLKIEPKNNECFMYVDSYTYETQQYNKDTKSFEKKTVPVAKIVDAEVPNPEYDKWLKEQEKKGQ
ncbi:MAG: hypothetical protein II942_02870 [Alphaproteobacteria bacterium]|nr:hypothetical protein [Alphaproteobacteria bacterium]